MWHWSPEEIALMRCKILEGFRWASRGANSNILTLHRNPIELFIIDEWSSAGGMGDYQEVRGNALPHLLKGQYIDMLASIQEDICPECGKGEMIFSPVLHHQQYCQQNRSIFARRWDCPACGASGNFLYAGRLERVGFEE